MRLITILVLAVFSIVLITGFILHFIVLPYYDNKRNAVLVPSPYIISEKTRIFHNNSFVADLHADPLLWGRDLLKRHPRGHIDLPRLHEGGVDLQVFGVVTKVPSPRNYDRNTGDTDSLPFLFIAAWRPPSTWFDQFERALVQAQDLRELAKISSLTLILSRNDLLTDGIKGLLSLEGMHALGGNEEALLMLYSAGFRMMGLAHHFDNEIAGSAHGIEKYGLTELGRRLIPRMESLGIIIDLAHASPQAIDDTLSLATKPVVVSHGGVQGTCPGNRNLTDKQLRGIANNAGVIGIGFWKAAICDVSVDGIVKAILYAIKVAGIDHVAIGSDFDGNVTTPFDASGLPILTDALLAAGLSDDDTRKILGGNVRRLLLNNLPE